MTQASTILLLGMLWIARHLSQGFIKTLSGAWGEAYSQPTAPVYPIPFLPMIILTRTHFTAFGRHDAFVVVSSSMVIILSVTNFFRRITRLLVTRFDGPLTFCIELRVGIALLGFEGSSDLQGQK